MYKYQSIAWHLSIMRLYQLVTPDDFMIAVSLPAHCLVGLRWLDLTYGLGKSLQGLAWVAGLERYRSMCV